MSKEKAEVKEEVKTNNQIIKFELPSGVKVEMDISRFDVATLLKARQLAPTSTKVSSFILVEICKFDGKTIIEPELEKFSGFDLMELEGRWDDAKKYAQRPRI